MDLKALEVRRVTLSEDLLHPGDFFFLKKRDPICKYERVPLQPPSDLFRKLWWIAFGKKEEIKQIIELQWPERDTVIVNCPFCNSPCATTKNHKIVSLEPLTIEMPITCPYEQIATFKVAEGKILAA